MPSGFCYGPRKHRKIAQTKRCVLAKSGVKKEATLSISPRVRVRACVASCNFFSRLLLPSFFFFFLLPSFLPLSALGFSIVTHITPFFFSSSHSHSHSSSPPTLSSSRPLFVSSAANSNDFLNFSLDKVRFLSFLATRLSFCPALPPVIAARFNGFLAPRNRYVRRVSFWLPRWRPKVPGRGLITRAEPNARRLAGVSSSSASFLAFHSFVCVLIVVLNETLVTGWEIKKKRIY